MSVSFRAAVDDFFSVTFGAGATAIGVTGVVAAEVVRNLVPAGSVMVGTAG